MKQYLDVEYAFRHPEGQQRFKVIHLTPGTGKWISLLVDTWRPLKDPIVYPGLGEVSFRVLQSKRQLHCEEQLEFEALAVEMNAYASFHYYLNNK